MEGTTAAGMEPFERLAAQGAMIERLSSDSRRCAPGVAFLAYPGEAADGRRYIADAVARGAAAVLWDDDAFAWPAGMAVPNLAVSGLKQRAGSLAHAFYGRPSEALWVCGVTGTNGKTSCSQWIAALLGARGVPAGVLGTLGAGLPGRLEPLANTTPDALEVHRWLRALADAGARAAAMEVSSHGLVQGRVNAVRFSCALFTNLSRDHLDYHGSMQAYADAKARLFDAPGLECAVLNVDDVLGVQLERKLRSRGMRTIGYSLQGRPPAGGEFLAAANPRGSELRIESSWGRAAVTVNQVGRFNLSNALGALGCLVAHGVPFAEAVPLLAALPAVPGRMQVIGAAPLVVVDYAHTPDALDKVLGALRPLAAERGGRLAAVFGAGGDRDPGKRPAMGAVASRLADAVLLTSDNPRSEDPAAIIAQVAAGMDRPCAVEPDRALAIRRAVSGAAPEDVVLIAGKGHEDYQEIAGRRMPFSDAAVARAALAERGAR